MNTFQATRETALQQLAEEHGPLPSALHAGIAIFGKTHLYYRTVTQFRLFKKAASRPQAGNPLIYGAALHLAADHTKVGSYALTTAVAVKCTKDIFNEYQKLSVTLANLRDALCWSYPTYHSAKWKQTRDRPLLSPSLYAKWKLQTMSLLRQMVKVMRCTLVLFGQIFRTSMVLRDAYLWLKGDSFTRYWVCTELVMEWKKYAEQLEEDKKLLVEKIHKNMPWTDKLFSRLNGANRTLFGSHLEALKEEVRHAFDETASTFYMKGKIHPLHINAADHTTPPPVRKPYWAGQSLPSASKESLNPAAGNLHKTWDKVTRKFKHFFKKAAML